MVDENQKTRTCVCDSTFTTFRMPLSDAGGAKYEKDIPLPKDQWNRFYILYDRTLRDPKTIREKWFCKKYGLPQFADFDPKAYVCIRDCPEDLKNKLLSYDDVELVAEIMDAGLVSKYLHQILNWQLKKREKKLEAKNDSRS